MKKYILAAVLLLGMAGAAGVSYGSGSTEDLMAPIAYTDWEIGKSKPTTGNLVAVRDMNTRPLRHPPAQARRKYAVENSVKKSCDKMGNHFATAPL